MSHVLPGGKKIEMLTAEGAGSAETLIRPSRGGGWRVELPRDKWAFVMIVSDQQQALLLAQQLRPTSHIRLVPASDEIPDEPTHGRHVATQIS